MHGQVDNGTAIPTTSSWLPSRRLINSLGAIACALLLAYGYFLQFYEGLEPCPLCIFQRIALFAMGIVFAVAAVHDPRGWGARVYGILILLVAAIGTALAARHVWIQSLPADQAPTCGGDLAYLMDAFTLSETIMLVLRGTGDCAAESWRFLGLTIPAWTLLWFIGMGLVGTVRNWMRQA